MEAFVPWKKTTGRHEEQRMVSGAQQNPNGSGKRKGISTSTTSVPTLSPSVPIHRPLSAEKEVSNGQTRFGTIGRQGQQSSSSAQKRNNDGQTSMGRSLGKMCINVKSYFLKDGIFCR